MPGKTTTNIQFLRTHRLQAVRQFLILVAGFMIAAPGWSAGWDAKIRLVNTVMHVPDVKAVLTENVSAKFEEKFPAAQYGIYVLIDKPVESWRSQAAR
ncbi:MAG: hypothetical protein IT507_02230 [Burkholderiaceae bacterium]|nr:hypothetical protein [Burkholderiaceae bacterium]